MVYWRWISKTFVAAVCTVAFAEVAATFWLTHVADFTTFKRFATVAQYEARVGRNYPFSYQSGFGIYPNPGYVDGPNRHNALGFRGGEVLVPKPPHTFRIACLGGSTTYDVGVADWHDAYPAQLETMLRTKGYDVEVVNAGAPSWTSREQLLNYVTRVSWISPDLIVMYDGINDLVFRSVWPPTKLRTDYTNPSRFVPDFAEMPWYWNLTLVRAVMIARGAAYPAAAIDPWWGDTIKSEGIRNLLSASPVLARSLGGGTLPSGVSTRQLFETSTPAVYRKNLSTVVQAAEHDGAKVLLMSFIADWPEIRGSFEDHGDGFGLGVAQMDEANKTVAAENGGGYFDLNAVMPQDHRLWNDIVHNNAAGAAVKARLIADFMMQTGTIPPEYRHN